MSVPQNITVQGSVTATPPTPTTAPFPSATSLFTINSVQQLGAVRNQARSISSPVSFIDLLTGLGLTNVKFLFIRVVGGTVEIRMTSAFGADQIIPCSDLLILGMPIAGSELTALAIRGVANIEMLVAGDGQ